MLPVLSLLRPATQTPATQVMSIKLGHQFRICTLQTRRSMFLKRQVFPASTGGRLHFTDVWHDTLCCRAASKQHPDHQDAQTGSAISIGLHSVQKYSAFCPIDPDLAFGAQKIKCRTFCRLRTTSGPSLTSVHYDRQDRLHTTAVPGYAGHPVT